MRKYKFRAYSEQDRIMYQPLALNVIAQLGHNFSDNIKLMQYTGLKDKNGVEIYEGDIVKVIFNNGNNSDISVVEYGEIDISNRNYDEYIMGYACGQHCLNTTLDIEVIGNIYENPELLN